VSCDFVDTGDDLAPLGDVNGDSVADFAIRISFVNMLKVTDFMLQAGLRPSAYG
jgi:hypothetical protein